MYIYIHTCINLNTHMYICMHMYTFIYVYVYVYTYKYRKVCNMERWKNKCKKIGLFRGIHIAHSATALQDATWRDRKTNVKRWVVPKDSHCTPCGSTTANPNKFHK